MLAAVEVYARPFAAFFEELVFDAPVLRPRPDCLGLARLPTVDAVDVSRDLCVECLRPESDCVCD